MTYDDKDRADAIVSKLVRERARMEHAVDEAAQTLIMIPWLLLAVFLLGGASGYFTFYVKQSLQTEQVFSSIHDLTKQPEGDRR